MLYTMRYDSPIGPLLLAGKEGALTGLWMEGQKYFPSLEQSQMRETNTSEILNRTKDWLDQYFQGEKPSLKMLPLSPEGSAFRKMVWKMLCDIPYGSVTTYGEIARRIAVERGIATMSAQAVGGAVGHNPISIIIPCHRVVGTDGSLTGYAGGLEKKQWLLALEGVDTEHLYVTAKGTAVS